MKDVHRTARLGARVFGAILISVNILAAGFSAMMLMWAIQQLGYEGERWGLLGVLIFGGIGLCVEVLLLLPTIVLAIVAKSLTRRFRVTALGVIIAAILLDVAALGCVVSEPHRHEQAFIQKSAMYQSGLRQAVLDHDVTRAQPIIEGNSLLLWETDSRGQNALLLAARAGDRPMIEMLLEHGADAASRGYGGITALHLAVKNNDLEIAKLLLDKGARVNEADRGGKTALAHAKVAADKAMVDLLVKHGGKGADYEALLVKAVEDGDVRQTAKLLDRGLSVSTSVPNGHCLLDFAAEKGNLEMAKFLISRGASAKRADMHGRTALHWASGEGNAEMVSFIVEMGADVNARDHKGETPLHHAIYWSQWHEAKSLEAIKALAEKGANVNAKSSNGITPLKYARQYGTDPIRAYLEGRGASD